MKRLVTIRAGAEEDLLQTSRWYEQKVPGLGDDFLTESFLAIKDLAVSAERRSYYYRDFRRVLLKRFPYKIFYRIEGDTVVVFRVLHAGREHKSNLSSE